MPTVVPAQLGGPDLLVPLVTSRPATSGLSTWPGDQANGGDYGDRASQGGGGPRVAEGGAQARSHQRLECQDHRRRARVQARLRPTQCDEGAAGGGGSKENDACCGGPRHRWSETLPIVEQDLAAQGDRGGGC